MKFGYILSKNKKLVEIARIGKPRFDLLSLISDVSPKYRELTVLKFNEERIIEELDKALEERKEIEDDTPNYEGRFLEEDIFVKLEYNGKSLKLCNTGFDNQIIFLINLLNSVREQGAEHRFLFVKTRSEYNDFFKM